MEDHWSWITVCNIATSYRPRIISKMVKWNSCDDTIILNTDGSYMKSSGKAGAGGIIRRRNGDMIMAFANPLKFSTINLSEVIAARDGIQWCCEQGMSNFKVELDSMLIVHMIKGICNVPWNLLAIIENIQDRIRNRGIEITHCYREGNSVADALAKHATTLHQNVIFLQENSP